ncbi:MAG: amidohydrolase family protein [Betaproteobacteria bacterium]|nr:amidohydrolase family protein [Betaproteobacteria bacterium]
MRYDLLLWADETRGLSQVPELVALREKYQGRMFKINSIKIFGTGASSTFGSLVWDQETLKRTAAALDKEKFRIYIHDIGPTSSYGLMLDAIEYATQQNGRRDARHTITHVSSNASPLVDRFKALDVIADGHPTPKAFVDAGVRVTSSSDYPVRDFFPLVRIRAGVAAGVSLDAMLASHTIAGAHLLFAENETGSLELGKAADIVVLDQNVLQMPAADIDKAKAVLTLFAGKVVFRDVSMGGSQVGTLTVKEQDDHRH